MASYWVEIFSIADEASDERSLRSLAPRVVSLYLSSRAARRELIICSVCANTEYLLSSEESCFKRLSESCSFAARSAREDWKRSRSFSSSAFFSSRSA